MSPDRTPFIYFPRLPTCGNRENRIECRSCSRGRRERLHTTAQRNQSHERPKLRGARLDPPRSLFCLPARLGRRAARGNTFRLASFSMRAPRGRKSDRTAVSRRLARGGSRPDLTRPDQHRRFQIGTAGEAEADVLVAETTVRRMVERPLAAVMRLRAWLLAIDRRRGSIDNRSRHS